MQDYERWKRQDRTESWWVNKHCNYRNNNPHEKVVGLFPLELPGLFD
jgi:hypothetical protein